MATLPARSPHTMHSLVLTSLPRCSVWLFVSRAPHLVSSRLVSPASPFPHLAHLICSPGEKRASPFHPVKTRRLRRVTRAAVNRNRSRARSFDEQATSNKLNIQEFSLILSRRGYDATQQRVHRCFLYRTTSPQGSWPLATEVLFDAVGSEESHVQSSCETRRNKRTRP